MTAAATLKSLKGKNSKTLTNDVRVTEIEEVSKDYDTDVSKAATEEEENRDENMLRIIQQVRILLNYPFF